MVGVIPPTSEPVAVRWLQQRLGFQQVATELPRDATKWASTGFLQVSSMPTAGDIDLPSKRESLLQLDAWGTSTSSTRTDVRPPWNATGALAQLAFDAMGNDQPYGAALTWPDEGPLALLQPVRVLSVYATDAEPTKVRDDPSGYARLTFDFMLVWAVAQ